MALDMNMKFGVLDGRRMVDEVMSPVEGGYCYVLHLIVFRIGWFEFCLKGP